MDDELPRLPGLRSWRAVYVFVTVAFVVYVVALTLLSKISP